MLKLLLLLVIVVSGRVRRVQRGAEDCDPTPAPTTQPTAAPTTQPTATPSTSVGPTTGGDVYTLTAKITGTFSSITGILTQNGNIAGDFIPLNFSIIDDQLAVTGTLRGVLSRTTRLLRQITQNVDTPLTMLVNLGDAGNLLGNPGNVLGNAGNVLGNPGRRRLLQIIPTLPISLPTSLPTLPLVNPTGTPAAGGSGSIVPTQAPGTCNVLHLALQGVTDLDLLGLLAHLEPTFLDLTANPVGGLLGSLLCAVGGLLNGLGPLGDLLGGLSGLTQGANLLNSILGLLNLANSTQGLAGLAPVTGLLNSILGILKAGA